MRLVKSKAAQDQDFERVVLGMTEDAKDVALRFEGAFVETTVNPGTVDVCITEGAGGPSLKAFKYQMESSFGRHCSRVSPEIDLLALEVFTR